MGLPVESEVLQAIENGLILFSDACHQLIRVVHLLYHGDFDWPGITIANQMIGSFGAIPWRFCTEDYNLALRGGAQSGYQLEGEPVTACWDDGLAPALRAHGMAIAEEGNVDDLINDFEGLYSNLMVPNKAPQEFTARACSASMPVISI